MSPQWSPCVSLSLGGAPAGASGIKSKWSKCKVGASTTAGENDRTGFITSLQHFMRPDLLLTRSSSPSELKNYFGTHFVIFWFPFFLISYFPLSSPIFGPLWAICIWRNDTSHSHLQLPQCFPKQNSFTGTTGETQLQGKLRLIFLS